MLLPSKHVGSRHDKRNDDHRTNQGRSSALHAHESGRIEIEQVPEVWNRDTDAATNLRNYCNDFLAEEEIAARREK